MTLIELLVVIIILTTIVAAAIPILSPSNDDRRLREASRGLNTYITGAQARAIALGRPFGIALKRLAQDTNPDPVNKPQHDDNGVCLEVFYVEQQPPFAGFDSNSKACVALNPTQLGLAIVRFVTKGSPTGYGLPVGIVPELIPEGLIRPGDIIEINGTRFELLDHRLPQYGGGDDRLINVQYDNGYFSSRPGNRSATTILARPVNDSGQQINVKHDNAGWEIGSRTPPAAAEPYWTAPAAYKIFRQATPASDEPYQLPEGTAIDLRASGVGISDYFYVPGLNDNSQGVLIMFAPEGRISRVSYSQFPKNSTDEAESFDKPVVDNVYLLVGKRENVLAPTVSADPTLSSAGLPPVGALNRDEALQELKEPINWLRGNSRWVVIGSQSGRIVTIENASVDPTAIINKYTNSPYSLNESSEELRNAQILAAREFTREMSQLGGR